MMKFRENILLLMVVVAVVSGSYPGGGWNDNPRLSGFPSEYPQLNEDPPNLNTEHQFFDPVTGEFRNIQRQDDHLPPPQHQPVQYINFLDDTPTQSNPKGNENYHLENPLPHHKTGYSAQPFGGDNSRAPAHQDFQPWYGQGYPQQQETNYPYHTVSTELNLGGPSNYQTDAYEPSLTLQPSGVQVPSQSFGEYETAARNPTGQFRYSTQIPFDPYSQYGNYGASTSNADFGRTNNEYPETSGRIMLRGSGSSDLHGNAYELERTTNLPPVAESNEGLAYDPTYQEYFTAMDEEVAENEQQMETEDIVSLAGADCVIEVKYLHEDHGILSDGEFKNILYPSEEGIVIVEAGKSIKYTCLSDQPNQKSFLYNVAKVRKRQSTAVKPFCFHGQLQESRRNKVLDLYHTKCFMVPRPFIKRSDEPCPMSTDNIHRAKYQIGVPMAEDFKVFVDVCVDNDTEDNSREIAYVKMELSRSLNGREQVKSQRKQNFIKSDQSFLKDNEIASMYDIYEQRISLQVQLSPVAKGLSSKYWELLKYDQNWNFLVPGKLIGDNQFIYRMEQRSADLYATTRPMWVHLERNWDKVEEAILQLALSRDLPITVYSGTHGVLTHADNSETVRQLYLGFLSGTTIPYQTIPELFFKLIVSVNPDMSRSCAVVVGHNTTYEVAVGDACTAVDLRWLDEHIVKSDKAYGVVYGCECKTFRREVLMKLPLWNVPEYSVLVN